MSPRRVLALVVLVWLIGLTGARDFLHNHSLLSERRDCPACRVERATGATTPTATVLIAAPTLVAVSIVPDLRTVDYVSGFFSLDPPPRSPPASL